MMLKYFYDEALAHASYLVGCQRAKEAIVVDPGRDIEPYLAAAGREGLRLVGVVETHIHADYVSGARELAERVGARLYVSDEGPEAWKYRYLEPYNHARLKDGDAFQIGRLRFEVLHTPGHTPESISILLTDQGGGADRPMGIFTGDFVFVGSIGRPDLLEEAAGLANTAEPGARQLFQSVERFKQLPDYLQVWPAHGAGSACGKGLGAIPSSTVGYEQRFNPALQFTDEDSFVRYILADQPEAPKYFAEMKRVNKEGPAILGPDPSLLSLPLNQLPAAIADGTVLDLSPADRFAERHVPGALNIPTGMLAGWAGWLVDYDKPTYLIADDSQLDEAVRVLHKIGVDQLSGYFDSDQVQDASVATQSYVSAAPAALRSRIEADEVTLLDVRSREEWNQGHIAGAEHRFLGRLPGQLDSLSLAKPIVVQCQSGARSAIAASLLQSAGFDVINMAGGYRAWSSDQPVRESQGDACMVRTSS